MKQSKIAILAFGVLGLLGLIIPSGGMSLLRVLLQFDKVQAILCLVVFGVPVAMAAIAMARPPMKTVHAVLSVVAFGLGLLKFRPWSMLGAGFQGIAIALGIFGGLAFSLAALFKREA